MAYNVLGNWCFASPDKGLRSKTRAGKMWVREAWERARTEGSRRHLADRTPRARTAPAAVTVCYV